MRRECDLRRIAPPVAGRPWENEYGMRFIPATGSTTLVSAWETRVIDFQRYAKESGLAVMPEMLSLKDGQWTSQGHNWQSPGYQLRPEEQAWIEETFLPENAAPTFWVGAGETGGAWGWLTEEPWSYQPGDIKPGP